jgi:hypothetical protein
MALKGGAEKLIEMCFQLLAFGAIQFLDLPKANEKMTKSYKQTPPRNNGDRHDSRSGGPWTRGDRTACMGQEARSGVWPDAAFLRRRTREDKTGGSDIAVNM